MDAPPELEAAATELYGLPLGEFVAARTAMEKAARAAGRRELAAAIKGLAKPSAAAGVANQLARAHPEAVAALLELGDDLRAATQARDGARLRELSTLRTRKVGELLGLARGVAGAAGVKVSDDTARGVEETLRAALADPELGARLAAGRLAEILEQPGFPGLFGLGEPDAATPVREQPAAPKPPPPAPKQRGETREEAAERKRREAAERRRAEAAELLAEAQADAETEAAALAAARERADAAAAELARLTALAEQLRADLARAVEERDDAVDSERRARAQLTSAERNARGAERRLADASAAYEAANSQD